MTKILIVEDEEHISNLIAMALSPLGYICETAGDGEKGADMIEQNRYDLILLDVMLPKIDGFELIEYIENYNTPVIFITAKNSVDDKVRGLKLGADDYITKPFSPTELLARVDSLYRRVEMHQPKPEPPRQDDIILGEFTLNLRRRTLLKNGRNIELTQVEFQMIEYFFNNPDVALDRTDILNKVWGTNYFGEEKIVDVNIRRLRMKVEDDPSSPKRLVTVWGMGYKWNTH